MNEEDRIPDETLSEDVAGDPMEDLQGLDVAGPKQA